MKKLLVTTAIIASLATSAFAGLKPTWNHDDINYPLGPWYGGNTYGGTLNMGCVFTGFQRGTMVYDEAEAVWNISYENAAIAQIEHRGVHSISVESTGNLWRGNTETPARSVVDYWGSVGISIDADAMAPPVYDMIIDGVYDLDFDGIDGGVDHDIDSEDDNLSSDWEMYEVWQTELFIMGKATMINGSDDLKGGKNNYTIKHTVTCLM